MEEAHPEICDFLQLAIEHTPEIAGFVFLEHQLDRPALTIESEAGARAGTGTRLDIL